MSMKDLGRALSTVHVFACGALIGVLAAWSSTATRAPATTKVEGTISTVVVPPPSPSIGPPPSSTTAGWLADDFGADSWPDGHSFVLASVNGADVAETEIAVRLAFADGVLTGSGGCNQLAGSYHIVDSRLLVDGFGGTLKRCEGLAMTKEGWLVQLIQAGPELSRVSRAGGVMVLTSGELAAVFEPVSVVVGVAGA